MLLLAAAEPARGPGAADAGPGPTRPADGGADAGPTRLADGGADAGRRVPLSREDREVVENLELLEHLPEVDVLELLLTSTDS